MSANLISVLTIRILKLNNPFKGVHSYKLFNKWFNKVKIVSETDDRVVLSFDNLKGYQRQYIYENFMEELKIIFDDKRIIFAVI